MRFKITRHLIKFSKVLTCSWRPEKLALLPEKNNCREVIAEARRKHLFADHQLGTNQSNTKLNRFNTDEDMSFFYIRRSQ